MSLDTLSVSPSLVDILCYLNHSDVLNCKLVNRRSYAVINTNLLKMPRNEVELRIEIRDRTVNLTLKSIASVESYVIMIDERFHLITSKQSNKASFFRFFTKYAMPEYGAIFEPELSRQQVHGDGEIVTWRSKSNDFMENLNLIFTFVFQRYHLRTMQIRNCFINNSDGMLDDFITLVAHSFRQSRCEIKYLYLIDLYPQYYEKLLTKLDSPIATIYFMYPSIMLEDYLNGLQNWGRRHEVWLSPTTPDILGSVVAIAKKWSTGLIDIPTSLVFHRMFAGDFFNRSLSEFAAAFTGIKGFSACAMLIDRDDGKQMFVTYSPKNYEFSLNIVL